MNINIAEFLEQFQKEYDFLYDHCDCVAGYREAVESFDQFSTSHKEFLSDFVKYRGDFISSDREAAAFMFALETL